jgi:hypothetical protein
VLPALVVLGEVALEAYLVLTPKTIAYRTSAGEALTVEVLAVQIAGAPAAVRMGSDRSRRVESFDPEEGYLVHRQAFGRSGEIVYERPLAILPAMLEPGKVHESQRRFARMRGGSKEDVGAHYAEAELLGIEELVIDEVTYPECLRVRRHETRMDFSGTQEVYDATEWYAKGVGLVKVQGESFQKNERGEVATKASLDYWVASGRP